MEWEKEVKQLGEQLVLSTRLGLSTNRLKGMTYLGRIVMVGQYYPYCPEPNRTVGLSSHTVLGILTILIQDQVGGLQVKHDDKWINLKSLMVLLLLALVTCFKYCLMTIIRAENIASMLIHGGNLEWQL
ncbi:hypothetical protein KSS87_010399, partial [Heliosperma pusillum]